jgi:hypothetical protein
MAAASGSWSGAVLEALWPSEYASVKFVRVHDARLARLHRAILVSCLAYVVGYQLAYDKGYQSKDHFQGTSNLKVKGVVRGGDGRVYDAADLTLPAMEDGAVFVQTNSWETVQRRGLCSGVERAPAAASAASEVCDCSKGDSEECARGECPAGLTTSHGVTTGRCVNTNATGGTPVSRPGLGWMCELRAWCPIEYEDGPPALELPEAGNLTLFVRVDGRFPVLAPTTALSNFDSGLKWGRNLFFLSDLVAAAELDRPLEVAPGATPPPRLPLEPFARITRRGAEVVLDYTINCDLDRTASAEDCSVAVRFSRVDGGQGFNYRSVREREDQARGLTKRYGLRLVLQTGGTGGKFDPVQVGLLLGAGAGLLGIATVVADMLLYTSRRATIYREAKYEEVQGGLDGDGHERGHERGHDERGHERGAAYRALDDEAAPRAQQQQA